MDKIISFELKKKEYKCCQHVNILIDEQLEFIECAECGERLDPIQYLTNLAREEKSIEYRLSALRKEQSKIENRIRTKCNYCGKMTRI